MLSRHAKGVCLKHDQVCTAVDYYISRRPWLFLSGSSSSNSSSDLPESIISPSFSVSCRTDLMDAVARSKCFAVSWPPLKKKIIKKKTHEARAQGAADTGRLSVNRIPQCWRWWDSSQAAATAVWSRGSEASKNRAGVKLGGARQQGLENSLSGRNVGLWHDRPVTLAAASSHWLHRVCRRVRTNKTTLCHGHCFSFFFFPPDRRHHCRVCERSKQTQTQRTQVQC